MVTNVLLCTTVYPREMLSLIDKITHWYLWSLLVILCLRNWNQMFYFYQCAMSPSKIVFYKKKKRAVMPQTRYGKVVMDRQMSVIKWLLGRQLPTMCLLLMDRSGTWMHDYFLIKISNNQPHCTKNLPTGTPVHGCICFTLERFPRIAF